MLASQSSKNIRGVQSGVLAQLSRDDLECLGVCGYYQLFFSLDFQGSLSQCIGDAHLHGTATGNDRSRGDGPLHHHERIVHASFALGNELLGASSQHNGARQRRRAQREQIESFVPDLGLLEESAGSENGFAQSIRGGLNGSVGGLCNPLHVSVGDPSRAEHAPIGKILGRQISNRQFRQDNVRPAVDAGIELVVNDLPFRVDDRLVILEAGNPNLRVFLFRLEFQFDIEEQDFRVLVFLGHLFEPGIGKRLFEGDSLHQKGLANVSPGDLFDGDPFHDLVHVPSLVQFGHGRNDHGRKQVPVGGDELAVEGRSGALEEHFLPVGRHCEFQDLVHRKSSRLPERLDHARRRDALLHQILELGEDLGRQQDHRRRPVPDRGILAHGNVHQGQCGGMGNVEEFHNGGPVVANGGLGSRRNEFVHAAGTQGGSNGIRDGLAGIDIAHELGQSLRCIRTLPKDDDTGLHSSHGTIHGDLSVYCIVRCTVYVVCSRDENCD
mmetsp:Transcript_4606/g.13266  ORF Transcript_4606/g.13266 Transcript_4606/m.13266 type:complete len:496 (+) Transcript_4606:485-1972(+)